MIDKLISVDKSVNILPVECLLKAQQKYKKKAPYDQKCHEMTVISVERLKRIDAFNAIE